jgi:HD superfamily phosphohydrolase
MVEGLRQRQPSLGITERDVLCVQIAGLCHDLGHGPFSHLFDDQFIPRARPGIKWTHEEGSEMMLEALVKENEIPIERDWLDFIRDLIRGEPNLTLGRDPPEKRFLFEIVANKRNSIDVDKFDYIARDTYNTGIGNPLSTSRLINSARVIDDEICYSWKDIFSIHELFHARFSLHKRMYGHKTTIATGHMVIDAFLAAEPVLKIAERIDDPERYLTLTDHLLLEIEFSTDPALAKARDIIHRLRKRKIYKLVDHKVHPAHLLTQWKEYLTPAKVVQMAKTLPDNKETLEIEDVIVSFRIMDHGMKDKNPLDFVRFYGKNNPNVASYAGPGEGSQLLPEQWQELTVQCYARNPEKSYLVQKAFRAAVQSLPRQESPTGTAVEDDDPRTPVLRSKQLESSVSPPKSIPPASYSPHEPNHFTTVRAGYKPQSPLEKLSAHPRGLKRVSSGEMRSGSPKKQRDS